MRLFDFSLCSLATLAMSFLSRELSWSWFCSIATSGKGLSSVAVSFKLRTFECGIAKKKENENKINCLNEYIKYNENLTVFEGSTGSLKDIGHLPDENQMSLPYLYAMKIIS